MGAAFLNGVATVDEEGLTDFPAELGEILKVFEKLRCDGLAGFNFDCVQVWSGFHQQVNFVADLIAIEQQLIVEAGMHPLLEGLCDDEVFKELTSQRVAEKL